MARGKGILMLGTSPQTMGGIAAVINVYRDAGLFERWPIEHVVTFRDGSALHKAAAASAALLVFIMRLVFSRPRLIHLHVSSRASFWRKSLFMSLARLARVPYLLHLHGSEFQVFFEKECGTLAQRAVRSQFHGAARVLVLSRSWAEWVKRACPRAAVTVLYNPVAFDAGAEPATVREGASVLFLGRLGRRKGSYDLVHAAALIAGEHPGLRLLMAGDGEADEVRALAARLGIESVVHLLGWIGPQQKAQLLATSAVFALPSYHEGLPMGVLEAMSAGMAIVSTPVGGIPEAIDDGVEGLLVSPGDVDALAVALRRLLASAALRRQLGHGARARVARQFATQAVLPELEAIYAQHVHRHRLNQSNERSPGQSR